MPTQKKLAIYSKSIYLVCDCTSISERTWDKLMNNAKKANGSYIRKMIKEQHPDIYNDLDLNFYNPYESQSRRTKTHLIYVHNATEHFFKVS